MVNKMFYTTRETAKMLGLAVSTLETWRSLNGNKAMEEKKGPLHHKFGRKVLYSIEEIEKYKKLNKIV